MPCLRLQQRPLTPLRSVRARNSTGVSLSSTHARKYTTGRETIATMLISPTHASVPKARCLTAQPSRTLCPISCIRKPISSVLQIVQNDAQAQTVCAGNERCGTRNATVEALDHQAQVASPATPSSLRLVLPATLPHEGQARPLTRLAQARTW